MMTAVSHALAERETIIGTGIKGTKLELLKDASEGRPLASSGVTERRFAKVYTDALDKLANHLWAEMKRVMEETYSTPYDQLEDDLRSLLCPNLREIYTTLCKSAEANATGSYGQQTIPGFQAQCEKLESKLCNEIGIFCASLEAQKLEKKLELMKQAHISITGDNARVNYNSQGNSITISHSKFDFRKLSESIEEKIADQELKIALKNKVAEMEVCVEQKSSIKQKYSEFMALAANHATALGPIAILLGEFVARHI